MDSKTLIDGKSVDCDESEENISEFFMCCVCLDILYKPIVLACGHVSCFWCVHKSMSGLHRSHCPVCRHPYHHFPTICQMLHFLLLKMYPAAYKRREVQILEEEEQMGIFSPQLDGSSFESKQSSVLSSPSNVSSVPCSASEDKVCARMQESESGFISQDRVRTSSMEENNLPKTNCDGTCNEVSITDALCSACKQLLYHPAVLNCGHVYCETCIIVPEDDILICQICKSPHPGDFPKVCLEFGKFLEEKFPKEYALRRDAVEHRRVQLENKSSTACSRNASENGVQSLFLPGDEFPTLQGKDGSMVHLAVGCDSCGMFPIVGDRYKCKDCVEAIGFDLCGDCYNTQSKLPGRFNQQHTPDHRLELIKLSDFTHNLMLGIVRHLEDGSPFLPQYAFEDSEDGSAALESSVAQQSSDDSGVAPVSRDTGNDEDQSNEPSSI
ncbi:hypothetical protein Nepgr_029769 [Nepenthes gracilis]|uniref:E3 ubiquitin-protein ligase PRT1 n=1 Tax=Nepenthes gracilis TaxID=150966 RepID=A0AAD3TEX9_NEPGR|nr:hypothetical protein Nepgr_029769 [Nepenthes gracilis]